ncbi:MAG: DGC domain protein [Desulfotomaculum sp. 46_80]|nr:MAG: DGC domain protein [Desulfotomaculum sp. 46_80]HAU30818.1 zinc-binding protein [Desulfotomaculum sp.]
MADECCFSDTPVLIFACSGGSNVGQVANQAAVKLDVENVGKIFCLAGLGGHVESFIESSRGSRNVVIDGCQVACAKKLLEHADIPISEYIVVTDLGIKKSHDFNLAQQDIARVCDEVKNRLS